jgi:excisionase family DNA binding protein
MLTFFTAQPGKSMPTKSVDNAIMTIAEVADYLKVTERTIYRLAGTKKIPSFKVGGSWRFSKADIDEWIKKQSIEGLDGTQTGAGQSKKSAEQGDK